MAEYRLHANMIKRSEGRSSVAAAAYRSCTKIEDHRLGLVSDYSKKRGNVYAEILAPDHSPSWVFDRERLWNEVEISEKRRDSQVAREIQLNLPPELTKEQQVEAVKEFVAFAFVRKGMIADINIHHDNLANPHAHIMLTTRYVSKNGFGEKNTDWNAKRELLDWREEWANVENKHLAMAGLDVRVDHRSYINRGIALIPQPKIGVPIGGQRAASRLDYMKERNALADDVAQFNGETIIEDPKVIIDLLMEQSSTFTDLDLKKMIGRYTTDHTQYTLAYHAVFNSDLVAKIGKDSSGSWRFTSKEMLETEKSLIERVIRFKSDRSREFHISNRLVQHELRLLERQKKAMSESQKRAYEHLVSGGKIKSVVGFAGTGKSFILGAANRAWSAAGYQVKGAALSGIAAQNLQDSDIGSRTIASWLYRWDKGIDTLTSKDVFVLDEAGMVGTRDMEKLTRYIEEAGAKLVIVGDSEQLQSIAAGAAYRAINERIDYVHLDDVRRQEKEWQKEATKAMATAKTKEALRTYDEHSAIVGLETKDAAKQAVINAWRRDNLSYKDATQIMLAYTRVDVLDLNLRARQIRIDAGEIDVGIEQKTARGMRQFAAEDRLYFLENNSKLGVKNGTLGTIERVKGSVLQVRLDGDGEKRIAFDLRDYSQVDYGYAATVHKSQGVTVDRGYLLATKHFDRHTTYVGASRHKKDFTLFYDRETFATKDSLYEKLSREKRQRNALDFIDLRDIVIPKRDVENAAPSAPKSTFIDMLFTLGRERQAQVREQRKQAEFEQKAKQFVDASLELQQSLSSTKSVVDWGVKDVVGTYRGVWRVGEKEFSVVECDDSLALIPKLADTEQHIGCHVNIQFMKQRGKIRVAFQAEKPSSTNANRHEQRVKPTFTRSNSQDNEPEL